MSAPAAAADWLIEALVALLLVASGVLSLLAAIGLLRFRTFYQRLHAAALVPTLSVWLVTIASIVYFWRQPGGLVLHQIVVPVLLAITVPVSTVLLMRVALFRSSGGSGGGGRSSDQAADEPR